MRKFAPVRFPQSVILTAVLVLGPTRLLAADPNSQLTFDIPTQPLETSLLELSKQATFQLIVSSGTLPARAAPALVGKMTIKAALERLLRDTDLSYKWVGDHTVTVMPRAASVPVSGPRLSESGSWSESVGGKGLHAFRVAEAEPGTAAEPAAARRGSPSAQSPDKLTEVVVTAQKRTERLQDVPVPVTAIDAQSLVDTNQFQLRDYYASVPGLNLAQTDNGGVSISIRGLTTGAGVTPTVGFTLDDVPFSSLSAPPNVDPNELARVEVLRGPQGTLYGASSIGGLIKYVAIDPSTEGLSGRLQVGTSGVHNGNGAGYSVSGSVNVPLTDTLAIRVNGFTHEDPGYIDNVLTGQQGVNKSRTEGGRAAALWRPSDTFTLKVNALIQQGRLFGSPLVEVQPGFAGLQQSFLGGLGTTFGKMQAYTANLTGKIGSAELTSLTGYTKRAGSESLDLTNGLIPEERYYGVAGAGSVQDSAINHFSQELRLSMPLGTRIDWLLGTFYTDDRTPINNSNFFLEDPVTSERGAPFYLQQATNRYQEYAAFTDLTFKLTDAFDVQLGGRESHIRQKNTDMISGPLVFLQYHTSQVVIPAEDSSENAFTYLVTPRYRFGPDLMAYARIASGYRPGGPNLSYGLDPKVVPKQFDPDKTQNYEVGTKGEFLDRRLSLDASVFYILWRDIQVDAIDYNANTAYIINASRAKSEGVELALTAKPLTGLTVSGWVVWNEAELTKPFGLGAAGDPLPYSSRFSGYASATQQFPLWGNVRGFAGASLSYVGSRESEFVTPRQLLPTYVKTDLQLGMQNDRWVGTFFVTNATDRRGLLDNAGQVLLHPHAFDIIQPRTVGLNVSRTF